MPTRMKVTSDNSVLDHIYISEENIGQIALSEFFFERYRDYPDVWVGQEPDYISTEEFLVELQDEAAQVIICEPEGRLICEPRFPGE